VIASLSRPLSAERGSTRRDKSACKARLSSRLTHCPRRQAMTAICAIETSRRCRKSTLSGHTGPWPWTLNWADSRRRAGRPSTSGPSGSPMLFGVQHSVGDRSSPILAVNRSAALPFYAMLDYAPAVHIPRSCSQEPLRAAMLAPRSSGDGRDGASLLHLGWRHLRRRAGAASVDRRFGEDRPFRRRLGGVYFLAAVIVPALRPCACLRE
jgi:hypothetical protein